ncbi:hypothetical protein [Burkholderia sp. USMB20]|uniref:hypothetical protein n=1 Tax=Burkholderia sp. USMB20 TaxID=1571773 RepID=UPI0005E914B2|nr:hypothetical protein [Burkholderia sp. USMB20]TGN96141.1 hypothetical protein PL79_019050 [Burkholderia sp. USMB20]
MSIKWCDTGAVSTADGANMKRSILAVLIATVSMYASAFDVDGFRTGMSVNEVATIVRGQGWELGANKMIAGLYTEAHYGADGKVAELGPENFSFCNGRLIAYSRELDFDTEYVSQLREMIARYGSQPMVEVRQQTWSGPGGGYISSVATKWSVGRERVEISFIPEGRTGNGALKNYRGAHISYVFPGQCPAH